jgi:hypothetical protein
MLVDVIAVTAILVFGNIKFRHFDPQMPLWKRVAKTFVAVALTGIISSYFGRIGVLIAVGIAAIPVIFIHAIWLPRHGVNGWTGEPRNKYYSLRGWNWPE